MTDQSATPESGALSIDEAFDLLDSLPDEDGDNSQAAGPEAAAASAPEGAADSSENKDPAESTPAEDASEAEEPGDGGKAEEDPAAAAKPAAPQWWTEEAKAKFAELPPELQATIAAQEGKREEIVTKARSEAAEVRKQAAEEVGKVTKLAESLDTFLPKAVEIFRHRWEGVDWEKTLEKFGAEETLRLQTQFKTEQEHLQKVQAAQQVAQTQARRAYIAAEEEKLAGTELADVAKRKEVGEYLLAEGVTPQQLAGVSAIELQLARKAMLWDRAQANLKAKPDPAPTPLKPIAKAGAAPGPTTPKAREASAAEKRFAQTRSIEDAIALLDAQG